MTRAAYQRSTLPRLGYTYERTRRMERHVQTRSNDTMYCSCGKSWDMNDPYPPEGCTK